MQKMTTRQLVAAGTAVAALGSTAAIAIADPGHGTMGDSTTPSSGTPMMHTSAPRKAPADMRLVSLAVTPDAMKGYNLAFRTKGFKLRPQHASGKHVAREGHAHLFVDGTKVTRLYGRSYYLGDLAPGTHVVRVSLNANDHRDYRRNGKDLAAEVTVEVPQP